jgi:hypothetical protein
MRKVGRSKCGEDQKGDDEADARGVVIVIKRDAYFPAVKSA